MRRSMKKRCTYVGFGFCNKVTLGVFCARRSLSQLKVSINVQTTAAVIWVARAVEIAVANIARFGWSNVGAIALVGGQNCERVSADAEIKAESVGLVDT